MKKILKSQLEKYFRIFRYHDRWKSLMLNDFTGSVNYTWTNDYKGYRYENKVATAALKDYMKQTDQAKISAISQYYVEQMIKLCRKNNVELILVSTPALRTGIMPNTMAYRLQRLISMDWNITESESDAGSGEDRLEKKDTRDKGDHFESYEHWCRSVTG